MRRLKIAMVKHFNTDSESVVQFALSERITNCLIERLHPLLVAEDHDWYRKKIGGPAYGLMKELFKIAGLSEVCFYTHSVHLYINKDADAAAVTVLVLDAIRRHMIAISGAPQGTVVEVSERDKLYFTDYDPEDSNHPDFLMPA